MPDKKQVVLGGWKEEDRRRPGKHPCGWTYIPLKDRFWPLVDKNGPIPEHMPNLGQCWIWTGGRNRAGYAKLNFVDGDRFRYQASHASLIVHGIKIPPGKIVCHHCDNRACVRPDHLFVGTYLENNLDCWKKGRFPKPLGQSKRTHCRHGHEFTEQNTVIDKFNHRRCRICREAYAKQYRAN